MFAPGNWEQVVKECNPEKILCCTCKSFRKGNYEYTFGSSSENRNMYSYTVELSYIIIKGTE